MNTIADFYNLNENKLKDLLKKTFAAENWLKIFIDDSHHGFTHGNQVRLASLKLLDNLNKAEQGKLMQAGKEICKNDSYESAVVAIEIAALFHDCGRFNENGAVIAEEQKYHHILSAQRAKIFCEKNGLSIIFPAVEEAILSHDFQSPEITPDLNPPRTIIGQIVQSADQLGWFHPDSLSRTLDFSKAMGRIFYNPEVTLAERFNWKPGNKAGDALTVMLKQLFGPTGRERFGIEFARKKLESYKLDLENNIIKIAVENNLKNEVEALIEEFKKNSSPEANY